MFDILILGSGPIGASTAYFLSKQVGTNLKIAVATQEPTDTHTAAYKYAGGSVRSNWPGNPVMTEMTSMTAEFIKERLAEGVDLSAIEDQYVLVHRGTVAPSYNIRSASLVKFFMDEARSAGVQLIESFAAQSVTKIADGYQVTNGAATYTAKKVLVAVGAQMHTLLPDVPVEFEKRQLFVLDLPVTEERQHFPHTVIPLDKGVIFIFIKKFGDQYKMVLGQEDIIEYSSEAKADDIYSQLVDLGLYKSLPFLKDAKVTEILWAFDYNKKNPYFHTDGVGLHAAVCGSAVRSSVYIGRELTKRLLA